MKKTKLTTVQWLYKIALNIFGLFLCGFGIVLTVQCGLGASPWDVFQIGMTKYLPITLGQASQIIALILLAFTWYKGVIPGVGTILNAIFIGYFIDLSFKFGIKTPETILMQSVMLIVSIVIFAFGIVLSLKAMIGVGTRDALMEYLIGSMKVSVTYIRAGIELFALVGGILLNGNFGSPFGIGTVVVTITLGYVINFAAKVLKYDFDITNHYTFKDMISKNKNVVENETTI
ncbi:YczE/YyaS/YitT family protein [Clostridium cylindrosporum]|uniref:YitT family protein n=1 Tax=Clostridium cylindrosporum DSM 605 TaxID=1121307 RepID=A0A0J8FZV6_CLOCY|nr:membrane protein [Clostridium cylindrosporum]KMT21086.1 hypothetical protein CLCY_1c03200 [Clostridium cylindrosporum DSM 605]